MWWDGQEGAEAAQPAQAQAAQPAQAQAAQRAQAQAAQPGQAAETARTAQHSLLQQLLGMVNRGEQGQ
eukprot:9293008-Prorocentrum_lima.AAC.1